MTGTSIMAEHQIKIKDERPILSQEPKNPRGYQCKGGRASPNKVHRAFKEPTQLPMVKKRKGKWRLCVDFRQINAKSAKDAYPI